MAKDKPTPSLKVDKQHEILRLKLLDVPTETRDAWHRLAVSYQRAANTIWQRWRAWHVEQGNDVAMYRWMEELKRWNREAERIGTEWDEANKAKYKNTKADQRRKKQAKERVVKNAIGTKPKGPVFCFPREMGSTWLYHQVAERFPELDRSNVAQFVQSTTGVIKEMPASRGSRYKRWQVVLAGLGEQPNFSVPQPIQVKGSHISVEPPKDSNDFKADWFIKFQCHRLVDQETGKGAIVKERCKIATKGNPKRMTKLWAGLKQLAVGKWKVCASDLVYQKNQWFLHLCCELDEATIKSRVDDRCKYLEADKEAVLEPARLEDGCPWFLHVGGQSIRVASFDAEIVPTARRKLTAAYGIRRHLQRIKKPRGRKRANILTNKSEAGMAHVKRYVSDLTCAKVVDICLDRQCGKLVFLDPPEAHQEKTWLASAGKRDSWPWFKVRNQLERLCQKQKIHLEIKPWKPDGEEESEGSGDAKKAGTARNVASRGGASSSANGNGQTVQKAPSRNGQKTDRSKSRSQSKAR